MGKMSTGTSNAASCDESEKLVQVFFTQASYVLLAQNAEISVCKRLERGPGGQ